MRGEKKLGHTGIPATWVFKRGTSQEEARAEQNPISPRARYSEMIGLRYVQLRFAVKASKY